MTRIYTIRNMMKHEIHTAIDWAAQEGWNPGLNDEHCFYQADNHGFFVGILDNKIISIGSAVCYDNHFAFCGFYIVAPEYRGQNFGLTLTKARLQYVGQRNAGIDGVMDMLPKYERLGYRIAHTNARYATTRPITQTNLPAQIKAINAKTDFSMLSAYDRQHFPAKREYFLNCWINQNKSDALCWQEDGLIKGYGVIRACREGFKIGPLFANTPKIAEALLMALANYAGNETVYLDISERNTEAVALVARHKMEKVFETARMYLKGEPELKHDQIFGITTFELG